MNSQERAVDHTRCWCHQPLAGLPPAVPVSPGGTAPAETIRRAVTLIRERAAGCQPRRWHWEALGDKRYPQRVSSDGNVAIIAETFIDPAHRPYEAEHIASWHPLAAVAVADWLEAAADGRSVTDLCHALAAARAYLGEGDPG